MAREAGPDFFAEWPREESNLRARIRSLYEVAPLCSLVHSKV
jgi:hypothetical protein